VPTAIPTTEEPELSDLEVLGTAAAVTATAQAAGGTGGETLGETGEATDGTGEGQAGPIISDDTGGEIAPPTNTPVGTPLAAEAASCPATHTVAGGENLYRIALRYDITYQELATANGIANPAQISTGVVLNIPNCGQAGAPAAPATGGTGQSQAAPAATPGTHTVAAGENLYRIALRYNMTWTTLAAANGITNPDFLVVGQTLQIPQ
jgi:LysM repeat protein